MASEHEHGVGVSAWFTALVDPHGQQAGVWDGFVADVGRVLGMAPSFLPAPAVDRRWIRAVLEQAAGRDGPVLVLPGAVTAAVDGPPVSPPRLHRAVIASDDSAEVVAGARLCALHLLRSGVQTKVVLVLTPQTAPPMWEGAGHHAEAWHAQLGRRYGPADSFEVCSGSPGAVVRARAAVADLVVLLWHRSLEEGRAKVVRAVLDEGVHRPCLLVPMLWVANLERRMEAAPGLRRRVGRASTIGA